MQARIQDLLPGKGLVEKEDDLLRNFLVFSDLPKESGL